MDNDMKSRNMRDILRTAVPCAQYISLNDSVGEWQNR